MAVYDLEEQEKLDELKAWWKQWGNAIIAAIAVFRYRVVRHSMVAQSSARIDRRSGDALFEARD